ncbi:hypothetical protein QQX10_10645 [Demequina sp. SYSU T00039]|uniref:Uncharacterized protein n=1 Tax=Demequina lignilytica TaxID=3051663 RepID=A0AAW7M9F7_9MICO|nr:MULTISPECIES: hypothetical protein [unclassified Demequina]MDN4478647.1 hypothetical protein [Demequina sp. SYSU T00039-1]MDN4488625.1 hypothetical protein [Demequina sp. SYSU T00039]
MRTVQINDTTYGALELAGQLTGMSVGEVIEKLVAQAAPSIAAPAAQAGPVADGTGVYADYNGARFKGVFDPVTTSITITAGALANSRYKSPSAAARAVVASERPDVDSNRNGWTFWTIDDGSGRQLQSLRAQ